MYCLMSIAGSNSCFVSLTFFPTGHDEKCKRCQLQGKRIFTRCRPTAGTLVWTRASSNTSSLWIEHVGVDSRGRFRLAVWVGVEILSRLVSERRLVCAVYTVFRSLSEVALELAASGMGKLETSQGHACRFGTKGRTTD